MKKIKLYCLPYAGGSAAAFLSWNKYLDKSIELIPLELSGRGFRFNEPVYESFSEMITDIYKVFCEKNDDSLYAFYGHSMGSLIVYELCHLINQDNLNMPMHLFISGRCPPHINIKPRINSSMDNNALKDELISMGGTPPELFSYKAILNSFLSIIRNDLRVVEKYKHIKRKNDKFDCPITVFNAKTDIDESDIKEWSKYTSYKFRYFLFEGGHFFINDNVNKIVGIINSSLL